jgi:signal transduction histidine kinase
MKTTIIKLIIAIAAFSLTVATVVGSITFSRSSEYLQREIESNVRNNAEKYANQFSAIFNHTEGMVDSLVAFVSVTFDPEELARDPDYMERYKEQLKGVIAETISATTIAHGLYVTFNPELSPNNDEVWYSYQDGVATYIEADFEGNLRDFSEPYPDDMQYYFAPIKAGRAMWTGPYFDRDIRINVLSYSKAIYAGDFFVGIAGADVTTGDTTDIIKSMHPYDNKGYAFLLNDELDFIITPESMPVVSLRDIIPESSAQVASQLMQQPSGNLRLEVDGKRYITGYARLNNGWILGISQLREQAFSPIYNLNRVLLGLGVIISLLIVLFSTLFSISFSRPISIRQNTLEAQNREKDVLLMYQSRQAKIGEMVGNIAHQWKQPLNSINLVLANIMDSYRYGELDEKSLNASISKAEEIIHNMSETISDFTGFLKPPKEKEHFDVHDSMAMALSLMEESLHKNNIRVNYHKEDSCMAYGYANEFSHVLFNIIGNARDAILSEDPPVKQIDINIRNEGRSLFIQVVNRGCKIAEDTLSLVFDPYFTTKEERGGTGIGLYISKVIIEQRMNGKIWLQNIEDGVSCAISLPCSDNIRFQEDSHESLSSS